MADAILKRCTQCGEAKPHSMFSPRTKNKDGLYSWCKPCSAARARAWAEKNKDRVLARNKERYWADPEAAKAKSTAYYRKKTGGGPAKPPQEPVLDDGCLTLFCAKCDTRRPVSDFYQRADGRYRTDCKLCAMKRSTDYVAKNRESVQAYKQQWTEENSERLSAVKRARYAASESLRADRMAKVAEWRAKNPEKRAAIAQNYKHRRRANEANGVSSADLFQWKRSQRKVCHWCGVKCADDFHIDHIQPLARGGRHILANLCIACPTCNIRKGAKDPIEFAQSLGLLL